jgi:LPXTG-motif cell wall-anchored protein
MQPRNSLARVEGDQVTDVRTIANKLWRKVSAGIVGVGLVAGGLLAIAPTIPAAAAPVGCSNNFFYIPNATPTQIIERTPAGVASTINTTVPGGSFSLALNPIDGQLYTVSRDVTVGNHVYLVAADGTTTDLGAVAGLPTGAITAQLGFDNAGNLWASYGGAILYKIDLSTMTSTTLTTSNTFALRGDFAYIDGAMYASISTSANPLAGYSLARIDLSTGTVTTITVPGMGLTTSYWSVSGHLYTAQGPAIYEVLGYNTTTPTLDLVTGLPTAPADGASCALASSPFIDAGDDDLTPSPITVGAAGTTGTIFGNDTINGAAITPAAVTATLTNVGGLTGATLAGDGTISVPAAATPGDYTLTYQICQVANPGLCDLASVLLRVAAAAAPTPPATITTATDATPQLAETGSDVLLPAGAAGLLLASGLVLMVIRRRRTSRATR